jgi:hypothetical protein
MSTYLELKGGNVKRVDSDPANPEIGQVWYNDTINQIKVRTTTLASWASGGTLNEHRGSLSASPVGTQTASICFGGQNDNLSPPKRNASEEYNGSSWTEGNNINTSRYRIGAAGTQTAGLGFGGYTLPGQTANTEEYNGTSWSEQNNLASVRSAPSGCGTQTAAVSIGGATYSVPAGSATLGLTEEYDGTSWTAGESITPALSNAPASGVQGHSCVGTQTAALVVGGNTGVTQNQVLTYDGTNYANTTALPRGINGGFGCGIQTAAIVGAGSDGAGGGAGNRRLADTIIWNGTSWTTSSASLASGRESAGSGGSSAAGLVFGGFNSASAPYLDGSSEEFTELVVATRSLDVS